MQEKYMHFGEYIQKKRKNDPRQLTITVVAEHIGISRTHLCDIENKRRAPFDGEKMKLFAEFLNLSCRSTAAFFAS